MFWGRKKTFATAMRMDANLESGQEVVDANPTDRPRRT